MADFYPSSMDARAAWHANFALQLPGLQAKYSIDAQVLKDVQADNAWMQHWVQAKHDADAIGQQMTKYFNTIAGPHDTAKPPAPINFSLSGVVPAEVPPGIEKRVRALAAMLKGLLNYSPVDGELLGIVAGSSAPVDPATLFPTFTLRTLANFELEATFRKHGMSALKFEYRHKNGPWLPAGMLINSPGKFAIVPAVPGEAEQIEIRAILLEGNTPVGNYSDAKPAFIAP